MEGIFLENLREKCSILGNGCTKMLSKIPERLKNSEKILANSVINLAQIEGKRMFHLLNSQNDCLSNKPSFVVGKQPMTKTQIWHSAFHWILPNCEK
jgi:hypothetical protein